MLCKNKKPHSFFACLLFLEGQQGAGNPSPTTFTDNSPEELFWRTYLNKKRQGLPASTEADLHFCMDVVGCGWCLAEAYHAHSKNNDLQWARSAHSAPALVLKQWHDIQKCQRDSGRTVMLKNPERSQQQALKQVAPAQRETSLLPKSVLSGSGGRVRPPPNCSFPPPSTPSTHAFSWGFMVVSEICPVWGMVMPFKHSAPRPWSLSKLKPLLFLTGCPELWRPLFRCAESSSLFTSMMFPLYPPPYIWTLEDKLGFVYSFGRWLDSDLTGT